MFESSRWALGGLALADALFGLTDRRFDLH